jgi:hypothetical protein
MCVTFNKMRESKERRGFLYWDGSQRGIFIIVYDCFDNWSDPVPFMGMVAALVQTRLAQAIESDVVGPKFALGIGVLHDEDRGRCYSFAHADSADGLPAEIRSSVEDEFGIFDGTSIVAASPSTP